jgi:hypothetical protein
MILGLTKLLRRGLSPFGSCGLPALLLGFTLLGVVNLAHGSSSDNAAFARPFNSTAEFAIADFDGDLKPDFATVQAGQTSTHVSRYLISFQLSAGSQQTIGLDAPIGGLLLDSRDVNGDHFTDLVVSTTWFRRTVAVLLNDGNGNFTVVDPSQFPSLTPESQADWSASSLQFSEVSSVPPSRPFPKVTQSRSYDFLAAEVAEFASGSAVRFRALTRTARTSGRAPPALVLHV